MKKALSKDYKGTLRFNEKALGFRISRGESLSGEAFETLCVLLADLALLTGGSLSQHPGILIHDSPREADLSSYLYGNYLSIAAELMNENEGDRIPFQYIVTTTTPPPERLMSAKFTKMELSNGKGALFGQQLRSGRPNNISLFDEES